MGTGCVQADQTVPGEGAAEDMGALCAVLERG